MERDALIIHCEGSRTICGTLTPPPDKSITIRGMILSALADGVSTIENPLEADTTEPLLSSLELLGAVVKAESFNPQGEKVRVLKMAGIPGKGVSHFTGMRDAGNPVELNLGASATALRLLTGGLAGRFGTCILTGDETLKARSMERVVEPLREMGARISYLVNDGYAPLLIEGTQLKGVRHELQVPSAQVKSAILIAGAFAEGITEVRERFSSRDHTERMLPRFGVNLRVTEGSGRRVITVDGGGLKPANIRVPGDFSSAFLPIILSLLLPGGKLRCVEVCLNPTRLGALRVLMESGAAVEVNVADNVCNEPVGEVVSEYSEIRPFNIEARETATMIDELPLLALCATQAEGISRMGGVGELRMKESDRAFHTVRILQAFGAQVRSEDAELIIKGNTQLHPAEVEVPKDHRMAMLAFACAVLAGGESRVQGFASVDASWRGMTQALAKGLLIGVRLQEQVS